MRLHTARRRAPETSRRIARSMRLHTTRRRAPETSRRPVCFCRVNGMPWSFCPLGSSPALGT
eukprot:5777314-Alexandrium_andersonii.AAC.1